MTDKKITCLQDVKDITVPFSTEAGAARLIPVAVGNLTPELGGRVCRDIVAELSKLLTVATTCRMSSDVKNATLLVATELSKDLHATHVACGLYIHAMGQKAKQAADLAKEVKTRVDAPVEVTVTAPPPSRADSEAATAETIVDED